MEKIASDLNESESKQRSLGRALEGLQSQASSALLFSLQWKDLEDHFESTRAQIQTRFDELKKREAKAKELEKVEELIDQGKKHLGFLEMLIEKKGCEVEERERLVREKERELGLVKKKLGLVKKKVEFEERELEMLEKKCEEVEAKKRELGLEEERFRSGIEECEREMRVKEERLRLVKKSIAECENVVKEKEMIVREMEECKCKIAAKESELEGWAVGLALKEKEVKSKAKEVSLSEKRVMERISEVEMKERGFDEEKKSIEEGRKHLDSLNNKLQMREWKLRKQAKELKLEKQEWESIEKSTKECTLKEGDDVLHSECQRTWDGRGLQLFMSEQLKRIDLMGSKMSDVLQGSLDPAKLVLGAMQGFHRSNLSMDSKEIDYDLEITRRSCIVLLEELKRLSVPISPLVKEEAMKLATEWKSELATENRLEILGFLQLLTTYELTSLYDAKELQSFLAMIAHPKEATESQTLGISDKASEFSISPCPVKDEEQEYSLAKNAVNSPIHQHSATVHASNYPGFLTEQMIWKYSIQNKIFVALEKSSNSDPAKLLLDLMQVSFAGCWAKDNAGFEATPMKSFISLLETVRTVQPKIGPQLKENATELAVQWKTKLNADAENSLEILGFLQFIATYDLLSTITTDEIAKLLGMISQHTHVLELCQTLGFADKFPGFILELVQRKQLVEAVRLICSFKLTDKFPPAPLLHQYVEDSWNRCSEICMTKTLDEKDKVVDSQIADLRAVIQCIKEYNLESEYRSVFVEVQIDELKKLQENWRLSAQSLSSHIEHQEQGMGKKRSSPSTHASMFQPQQQPEYNDQLKAISAARPPPYPSPTCIPSYPQSHSAPVLQTNFGIPGQFALPANVHPFSSSNGDPFVPTVKRPCIMNPGYQAPAPAPSPAPTPAQMHSANYSVPYQFPHPNMMQFRGR